MSSSSLIFDQMVITGQKNGYLTLDELHLLKKKETWYRSRPLLSAARRGKNEIAETIFKERKYPISGDELYETCMAFANRGPIPTFLTDLIQKGKYISMTHQALLVEQLIPALVTTASGPWEAYVLYRKYSIFQTRANQLAIFRQMINRGYIEFVKQLMKEFNISPTDLIRGTIMLNLSRRCTERWRYCSDREMCWKVFVYLNDELQKYPELVENIHYKGMIANLYAELLDELNFEKLDYLRKYKVDLSCVHRPTWELWKINPVFTKYLTFDN